jgi:CheY-like chemotaxis protein
MSEPFDLPHLLTDVIADVQPTADDKGVHVAAHNLAAVPQWVEGDEAALRRMLLNTLDLVVGAATDGTVNLRLQPHESSGDRWICVVGWRAAGEAAIHEVKSAFIVTLRSSESTDNAGPFHILVVDDSAQHRSMVATLLSSTAHVVTEAESGEDAIRRVGAARFDVILMDCQMPGMGGIEAIGVIRAFESTLQQPPAYVIALSTMGANDDEADATLAGADTCLPKPLSRDELFRALAAVPMPAAALAAEPVSLEPPDWQPSEEPDFSPAVTVGLSAPQLLALARHQLGAILLAAPGTQVERLRLLGQTLKTSAGDVGLTDIAHLAGALEEASATGSLTDAQRAARTLQAWLLRTKA